MPNQTCFFTGHRSFSKNRENVQELLRDILLILIESGVTDFYAGGAIGWDMFCESELLNMKKQYPQIKLHIILPCPPEIQTQLWNDENKKEYAHILSAAESTEIVSEIYSKDCMKMRNTRLVDSGNICVCYFNRNSSRSGTAQTVRMAYKKGKTILNLYYSR